MILMRTSISRLLLGTAVVLILVPSAVADVFIGFDQETYDATLGDTFTAKVLFDMDDQSPGHQMPNGGLLTAGVLLNYDSSAFQIADPAGLTIPNALNSNGLGGAPETLFIDGNVGYAGALSLSSESGYENSLLATVRAKPLKKGDFTFTLDHFYSTKANVVDMNGNVLDDHTTFESANVNVVPEPSAFLLYLIMSLPLAVVFMRRLFSSKDFRDRLALDL